MNLAYRAARKLRHDGARETVEQGKYEIWKRLSAPVTDRINSRFGLLERDELRSGAELTVPTETAYVPYKGELGVPDRTPQAYYEPGDRFVTMIEDARLIGRKGLALTPDDRIVVDCVGPPIIVPRRPKLAIRAALRDGQFRDFRRTPDQELGRAAVLLPCFHNYYHWTVGNLMKIYVLEQYGEEVGEYPALVVPEDRPGWMDETLEMVSYPGDIIGWGSQYASVRELIVPSFPDPVVEECRWLRQTLREAANVSDSSPERVLITRRDATIRRLANLDAVERALAPLGFETVTPGEYSVAEQVRLFEDTELIVGPHGAGLTNLLYATDTTVVELFGMKRSASFARLCEICGHGYARLECDAHRGNLLVDTDRLVDVLEEVLQNRD